MKFQINECQSYLGKSTCKVVHFADDEIAVAESNEDVEAA